MHPSTTHVFSNTDLSQAYSVSTRNISETDVYIPPGDERMEIYRLSTFKKYPASDLVNTGLLAKHGFFWTGVRDQIKCFSCTVILENIITSGILDLLQHSHEDDCDFNNGTDIKNIPINSRQTAVTNNNILGILGSSGLARPSGQPVNVATATSSSSYTHMLLVNSLNLSRESDRLKSFLHWPKNSPVMAEALAKSGFFYLGNDDRVQCASCKLELQNWSFGDDVYLKHQQYTQHCYMVLNNEGRNVPLESNNQMHTPTPLRQTAPPKISEQMQRQLSTQFPCTTPANPHMRSVNVRLETFSNWPIDEMSPNELATAGFFFLGNQDQVACWYCNGGLQNWEPKEQPWEEHAKWFPSCHFALRSLGPAYIANICQKYPNLPRPVLTGTPVVATNSSQNVQTNISQDQVTVTTQASTNVHSGWARADSAEENTRKDEMITTLQTAIHSLLRMSTLLGFDSTKMARCIVDRYGDDQHQHASIDYVISKQTDCSTISTLFDIGDSDFCKSASNKCTKHQHDESQSVPEQAAASSSHGFFTAPSHVLESEQIQHSLAESMPSTLAADVHALNEEILCKKCNTERVAMIFFPCCHFVTCVQCGKECSQCPLCYEMITHHRHITTETE